jgi:hypothetical protein
MQRFVLIHPSDVNLATIEETRALDDAALLVAARGLDERVPADDALVSVDRYGAYDGVAATVRWIEEA